MQGLSSQQIMTSLALMRQIKPASHGLHQAKPAQIGTIGTRQLAQKH
jgi:hypothetical protein